MFVELNSLCTEHVIRTYIFICQLAFALFKKCVGGGAEKRGRMRIIFFMRMRESMRAKGGWLWRGKYQTWRCVAGRTKLRRDD